MKTHVATVTALFGGLLLPIQGASQAPTHEPMRVDQIDWVDPPTDLPSRVAHYTFHSSSMDLEVGYSIYLPPGYEELERNYPVVYWLHGRSGSESDTRPAQVLHEAIQSGGVQPMVLVLANGGTGSGYIDNPDTGVMGESVVIEELIPHIESNYRVIRDRSGRGFSGFSMGGSGAIRLSLRHPRMFSSVVSVAGVLVGYREIMERNFVADAALARSHDPYPLAVEVEARLRSMNVKLIVGSEDQWITTNRRFAAHLGHLNLTIDYKEIRGIDHNLSDYLAAAGHELFAFHSTHLESDG